MNKSQSSSVIYEEMDRFEKNGSKYPFEVIWINPKWGREIKLILAQSYYQPFDGRNSDLEWASGESFFYN